MSALLLAAALVLYVLAAVLAFGVFGSATVLDVVGLVAVGEACVVAAAMAAGRLPG